MNMIANIRNAAQKRAAFRRTAYELRNMPLATAIDFDFFHEDAVKIAHQAVYGN